MPRIVFPVLTAALGERLLVFRTCDCLTRPRHIGDPRASTRAYVMLHSRSISAHIGDVFPEVADELVPKAQHVPEGRLDDEVQDKDKNVDRRKFPREPVPSTDDRHGKEIDHRGERSVTQDLPAVRVVAYAEGKVAHEEKEKVEEHDADDVE